MDLQLTNKKALVTGSTAGIGFAIASLLAQEGAAVVLNGRSQQRVDDAVQRIESTGFSHQRCSSACRWRRGPSDQRDRLVAVLEGLGYLVKRVGG